MSIHIALLRGINVGGHKKVAMTDLRALLADLGFGEPRTLLQSGNVVFRSDGQKTAAALETLLETEAGQRLGLSSDFHVRPAEEWPGIIAANPFHDEAARDPGHLVVVFLKTAPSEAAVEKLRAASQGPERIQAHGRHLYVTYPAGIGDSRLTAGLMDAKLGTRGTARNWNTVLKLGALAGT